MAILAEYALTPDVFDVDSYSNEEVCGLHLQSLKEVLINEGLVRDLRLGDWGRLFLSNNRPWHHRGKELLQKLKSQNRLISFPHVSRVAPTTDAEWCDEALAAHKLRSLTGVIVSDALATLHRKNPLVASVKRVTSAPWWTAHDSSLRTKRNLLAYQTALELILRHANSLIFIDPYLDPSDRDYSGFLSLFDVVSSRSSLPVIEIHRAAWYGSGPDKTPKVAQIKEAITPSLSACAKRTGLIFKVVLWNVMHDRYLISDLVGITLPYGFSTTTDPNAVTTWSRLGRKARDDVQRDFDVDVHEPRHQFIVE